MFFHPTSFPKLRLNIEGSECQEQSPCMSYQFVLRASSMDEWNNFLYGKLIKFIFTKITLKFRQLILFLNFKQTE